MQTRQIALLRPQQIKAELQRCPLAFLPLGPLEWHGPHLPFGTDPLYAERIALAAAEQTKGLVFPTLYMGTERERTPQTLASIGLEPQNYVIGMDFPANTLPSGYAYEEVFALVVREHLRLILKMGFRWIVIISGHGATNHLKVLHRLVAEFNAESSARFLLIAPFPRDEDGIERVGHADRIETSLMLAEHPELVDLDALPPLPSPLRNTDYAIVDYLTFEGQPTSDRTVRPKFDPRQATAEDGQTMVKQVIANIVQQVNQWIQNNS